jgi:hypothetical protein
MNPFFWELQVRENFCVGLYGLDCVVLVPFVSWVSLSSWSLVDPWRLKV